QQGLYAVDDGHQAAARCLQVSGGGGLCHRASPASSGRGALAEWVGAIGAMRGGAGGRPPAAASIAVQAAKCGARSICSASASPASSGTGGVASSAAAASGGSGVHDTRISTSTVEGREASAP